MTWRRYSRWQIGSRSSSTAAPSRPAPRRRSGPMPRCARRISASRSRLMADSALLEISNVETCYGLSQVLFGMSFAIGRGEMVTLMGRNGMGKTTTVRSIMGLTRAMAGSIRFDGREIRGLDAYQVAKLGIGLVPEGRQIFPNLTARENLVAAAANREGAAEPWTLEKVCRLFPRLHERLSSMGTLLSGGEQQMLAIEALTHVPFEIVGQHAEQHVCAHPV